MNKIIMGTIALLAINPKDAKNNSALVDGVPAWASSDETVATVEVAADGLSATVTPLKIGTMTLTVTADVLIGPEIKPLSDSADFEVISGEAVSLNLTVA